MKVSIIERQIGILRKVLSDLAENDKNDSEDFILFTKKYFGFENDSGWNILMNAFYVFEDTELAKKDFEQFKLQGPSRHKNIGEKYLRLYGILNSFYQQNLALINLMELFKFDSKNIYRKQLNESDCIILRNKIASHSTNYLTARQPKKFDVYEISRPELENGKIHLLKNQDTYEYYDLNNLINDFNEITQNILSKILKKFIQKKFNNQGKYYKEYIKSEKLRQGATEIGNSIIEFE